MTWVKIKGHEFNAIIVKDSFNRRAIQYSNNIIGSLRRIGLTEDDIEIPLEASAIRKAPAKASWYFEGYKMHYSYQASEKYVENLYVVSKVIELEIESLINEVKTVDEFIKDFSENDDVEMQRKNARSTLGLSEDTIDVNLINQKYKELSKECHPDKPNGNVDKFKEINNAHKILVRELM